MHSKQCLSFDLLEAGILQPAAAWSVVTKMIAYTSVSPSVNDDDADQPNVCVSALPTYYMYKYITAA